MVERRNRLMENRRRSEKQGGYKREQRRGDESLVKEIDFPRTSSISESHAAKTRILHERCYRAHHRTSADHRNAVVLPTDLRITAMQSQCSVTSLTRRL
ncbi:hypothetical protein E2542_SST13729 [Spatholobus suberectus]|nr:hypothetical protein E2542_SST13729 [Spatholobus suberectus]